MDPITAAKLGIEALGLLFNFLNGPREAPQCAEPRRAAPVSVPAPVDFCANVSEKDWIAFDGDYFLNAYEGVRSRSDICRAIVDRREYEKRKR